MHPKPEEDEQSQLADRSPNRVSIDRTRQDGQSSNHNDANNQDETPNLIQLEG